MIKVNNCQMEELLKKTVEILSLNQCAESAADNISDAAHIKTTLNFVNALMLGLKYDLEFLMKEDRKADLANLMRESKKDSSPVAREVSA